MPRSAARSPSQTYRAPRAARRETFAPGQRDIAYDPRTVDRSNCASIRAPRSAAAGPSTALRAPWSRVPRAIEAKTGQKAADLRARSARRARWRAAPVRAGFTQTVRLRNKSLSLNKKSAIFHKIKQVLWDLTHGRSAEKSRDTGQTKAL